MIGTILGFEKNSDTGDIKGRNGKRYPFNGDSYRTEGEPKAGMDVDYEVDENGNAVGVYVIAKSGAKESKVLLGIISLVLTYFLGFVGTFISRLVISEQDINEIIAPTLFHAVISAFLIIPFLGLIPYTIGTLYFMYRNYQLAVSPEVKNRPNGENKYA